MIHSTSRVLTGWSTTWSRLACETLRHRSTTSSIRAGLQAEQGSSGSGSGRYGDRTRSREPVERSSARSSGRFKRGGDGPPERKSVGNGRAAFGPRTSPSGRLTGRTEARHGMRDGPAASRDRPASPRDRPGASRDRPASARDRPDSFRSRQSPPSAQGRTASRNEPGQAFASASRTPRSRESSSFRQERSTEIRQDRARTTAGSSRPPFRQASPLDARQQQLVKDDTANSSDEARKERRARWWSENAPDEDAEDAEDAEPPLSRGSPRLSFSSRPQRARTWEANPRVDEVPVAIPYTTASSQFIYGANTVLAALRAEQRKIYKLYMHKRSEAENIAQIRRAATALSIELVRTADTAFLDRVSEGRPHNGVVLEVSPIPARPVLSLETWDEKAGTFGLELAQQDAEDAAINGTETKMQTSRTPLVVFLDGITDPGNVGNLLRTAHFFGADAVAIASQTCASITSPVLAKASAGACEAIPIFRVPHASGFIYSSREQGWTICAAVAPADAKPDPQHRTRQYFTVQQMMANTPLAGKPCILMLGAEGEGLRENLTKKADVFVTIKSGPRSGVNVGVDSLNVATAGALLINAMVSGARTFSSRPKPAKKESDLGI